MVAPRPARCLIGTCSCFRPVRRESVDITRALSLEVDLGLSSPGCALGALTPLIPTGPTSLHLVSASAFPPLAAHVLGSSLVPSSSCYRFLTPFFQLMFSIPYFFGCIAKMNEDWLLRAQALL